MNIHQPLIMKKIQNKFNKVAFELKLIGADDWAEDIKQTAHAIEVRWKEERNEEKQNSKNNAY